MYYLNFFLVLIVLLTSACSSQKKKNSPKDIAALNKVLNEHKLNQVLIYGDNSGKFSIKRTMSNKGDKLLFQRMIYQDDFSKFLERSRSVSIFKLQESEEKIIMPVLSQYKAWFDGVEYSNQFKISYSKRDVEVLVMTKDSKYPPREKFSLPPENKKICFFSMIPECIKLWGIHKKTASTKNYETWFYVIMDAYPFIELQYNDIPNKWIIEATLVYDGMQDKEHQFTMELHEQVISLKYNENWDFIALYWVSQGLTMVTN